MGVNSDLENGPQLSRRGHLEGEILIGTLAERDWEIEASGCIARSHARGTCDEPRENADSERIIVRGGGGNSEVANVCSKVLAPEGISLCS